METRHNQFESSTVTAEVKNEKKISYAIDVVLWTLWVVLMWGFLIAISVISSPSDRPGIHELIITGYFLGFSAVFGIIYMMVLKRG